MHRAASFLRTRPPVDEQGEEVGRADGAVAVEIPQALAVVGDALTFDLRFRAQPPLRLSDSLCSFMV